MSHTTLDVLLARAYEEIVDFYAILHIVPLYKGKGHLHGCPMLLPNYEFAPPIMTSESMYLMFVSDLSSFWFCFLEEI